MEACARASYLHEVIMRMPMGYETLIGELGKGYPAVRSNGCSLPGHLQEAGDFVLDEATSALDKESEAMVNQAIKALQHNTGDHSPPRNDDSLC